jgi:diguanylate cyclase (GGDEF)-like protein/PAS domain S-box-containing protein
MVYKNKNEEQNLTEPHLIHTMRKRPDQTESEHERENNEQVSSCDISIDYSSNEWFTGGSDDMYVVNYTDPKPEIDQYKEYTFSDLVDIELLQKLFTSYYMITKIPNAVLDADNNILSGFGWQDICTNFHRVCPETLQRCFQSDSYIAAHLHKGPYIGYKCLNGLLDYATPIVIEGRHLATIFTGQFFHEPPDEDFFRQHAQNYRFDEEAYLDALRKVPIIPKNNIKFIMEFFSEFGQFLAILGLKRKRELEASDQALRDRENRYRILAETIPDLIIVRDKDLQYTYISPAVTPLLGYTVEEMMALPMEKQFTLDTYALIREDLAKGMVIKKAARTALLGSLTHEVKMIRKDGSMVWVEVKATYLYDQEGQFAGVQEVISNITERKEKEEQLRKSEQKYRSIFENATEGIFQTTPQGHFISINPAFFKIHGYDSAEEMIDQISNIAQELYTNPDDREKLIKHLANQDKFDNFETDVIRKDGNKIRVSLNIHVVRDQNSEIQYLEGTCVDITEREEAQARLEYLSYRDPLTGLYNRNYFEAEMQRLQELDCITAGIIMGDFDGLKLVNDTLGNKTGDELLVAVSQALKACFRDEDVVARVGGDEFSIILPFVNERRLEEAVEQIRTEINNYNVKNPMLPLSLSLGFAFKKPDDLTSIYDLIKQADDKMYREKLTRSNSAHSAIVNTLIKTMEARDNDTEKHAERLINIITAFAREINLTEAELAYFHLFAQFHDIGKVGIPDSILLKPGPLTPGERMQMQSHSEIGYRIAQASQDLTPIAELILKHHEWWDGNGYPLGLEGKEIPLECRILAIADAYDAMTSNRPYRRAKSHRKAIAELKRVAGTQFDPELVDKFITSLRNPSLAVTF